MRWAADMSGKNANLDIAYSISLAHGSAANQIFFAKCVKANQNFSEMAKSMLEETVKYTLRQHNDGSVYSIFPSRVEVQSVKNKSNNSRMAWCNGDLGIGLGLWHSADVLNSEKLRKEATSLFLHDTKRNSFEETYVKDATICHGSAGIALIYKRMYHNTGIEAFKECEEKWIADTLNRASFDGGDAGYKFYYAGVKEEWYENCTNLLEGIVGVGLTLLANESGEKAAWDELFLLS